MWLPRADGGRAAQLVDVDGDDQDRADGDLLPERLDADDDEAVLQHGRDEQPDDGAEDRSDAAEQRRAADDDGGDDVEVGLRLTGDRRGAELGERQDPGHAGEQPGDRVDLDQVPVDLEADAARRLLVRADRVRVTAEPRAVQDHGAHDDEDEGDHRQDRHVAEHVAVADVALHDRRARRGCRRPS